MTESALKSRMGRRIALTFAVGRHRSRARCWRSSPPATLSEPSAASVERRLTGVSQAYARSLRSRLGAAETIVQTLTARDVGYDGSALKQQIVNSRAFKSAVVVDRDGLLAGGDPPRLRPSPAQLVALDAGQTVVLHVVARGQLPAVFLARAVTAGGFERLAYFEIAPDWLWKDLSGGILVHAGRRRGCRRHVLQSTVPLLPETGAHVRASTSRRSSTGNASREPRAVVAGRGRGVARRAHASDARRRAHHHGAVGGGRARSWRHVLRRSQCDLGAAAVCAGRCAAAWPGAARISGASPRAARSRLSKTACAALTERRFDRLSVAAADEPRDARAHVQRSLRELLEEQFRALETLGEIDQMLLGSAELEQMLESILARVQTVTRCHSVGITLRDADAPGRGRIYLAANGLSGSAGEPRRAR